MYPPFVFVFFTYLFFLRLQLQQKFTLQTHTVEFYFTYISVEKNAFKKCTLANNVKDIIKVNGEERSFL